MGLGYYRDRPPAPLSAPAALEVTEPARDRIVPNHSTRETDEMIAVVIAVGNVDKATITTTLSQNGCEAQVSFSANDEKHALHWRCSGVVQSIAADLSPDNLVVKLLKQNKGAWTAPAIVESAVTEEKLHRPPETNVDLANTSRWLSRLSGSHAGDGIFDLD